jgi:putative oxidoreductase
MKWFLLLGRLLFSLIFIQSVANHFSPDTMQYAANAGVPFPRVLVPASGIMAALGGLSIVLGWKARWGAWLIVLFLVPVTLAMHHFWNIPDPMMHQMQQAMFMKNVSMLGGALIIAYFGAGPLSIDNAQAQPVTSRR